MQRNYYLLVADYRYRLYLDLLVSVRDTPKETWPMPPWYAIKLRISDWMAKVNLSRDVALMMHTHLLSPIKFANDISSSPRYNTLAGVLDFPLMKLQHRLRYIHQPEHMAMKQHVAMEQWYAKFPARLYNLVDIWGGTSFPPMMIINSEYNPKTFKFTRPPPFSLDLREAVKRQIIFARKITSIYPHDPVPGALLLDSQQRYAKFMNLIRLNATPNPVPALDIDLFWHTHQLSSSNYLPWCRHHIGRPVNHDDTVGKGDLATGLDETIAAWESTYSEDYLNPSPGLTFQNASSVPHESSTADKTPPPGLTPAQLRLWNFDVLHQEEHENLNYILRQLREEEVAYNEKIAKSPAPSLSFSSPAGGGSPMMRLLRIAAMDHNPYQTIMDRNSVVAHISRRIRSHAEARQSWGRERWPLLVAARGWGDPTVTHGKFVRPPQGTAKLNFPIYAATWYDEKQLGYYDYVTGGKGGGGAIEGGGVRVGGGMLLNLGYSNAQGHTNPLRGCTKKIQTFLIIVQVE
jgi:hypothetical protein